MVLGRFKDAVSDVAETLRRAFRDPPSHAVPSAFAPPGTEGIRLLKAAGRGADYRFAPTSEIAELSFPGGVREEAVRLDARLRQEDAWSSWAAGAKVCGMIVFRPGQCGRVAVPPLPRTVPARSLGLTPFRTAAQVLRQPLPRPGVRIQPPRLDPPRTHRDLERVLALPIAIPGEDFQKLPKARSMRYTVQLVKATGENIRNLDVLGVYLVPVKGVDALRHDGRTGRILVHLAPEAVGAARGRFLLARRKDDRSFVSCFVED